MQKVFPIKSATACLLKWTWSTVFIHTQTTSSCHRVDQDDITLENFDSFHNTPRKIAAREKMLKGEWPGAGCEYCKKIEDAGGMSDRQLQLQLMDFDVPKELTDNPAATSVTPTMLEVYFSNVCNMGCLYCGSRFSSLWEAENNRFGQFIKTTRPWTKIKPIMVLDNVSANGDHYEDLVDKFFAWLENNYKSITKLHILGGEPFHQLAELERCIDFYDTHPNPELSFGIITNLKVAPAKFQQVINKLLRLKNESKIGSVSITGSIDSWGAPAEYVRYGLDLTEYTANIEYLLDKEVTVCVNSAINSLGIKTMPALVEKINYWNSIRKKNDKNWQHPIYWTFMTVQPHLHLCPDIFDKELFQDDFDKVIALMPTENEFQQHSKEHMIGIAKQVAATSKDRDKVDTLKEYLDEMDSRRNTNWKEVFPWLIDQ